MRNFGLCAVGLMLAGCNGDAPPMANEATAPVATPSATPSPVPTPTRAAAFVARTEVKTADYDFGYAMPDAVAAYGALVDWLNHDRDQARAGVAKEAADFRKETERDGFPFRKYESTTTWQRVAETPRFLSLSAETYDYTGGAHGSPGFRSLVWDRQAGKRLEAADVFTSPDAIQQVLGAAFCDALDVQREKRRGAPVVRGNGDSFNDCPKVAEATLILGSTDGRAIDRVGLLVGPYVAGSYAEGSYDLTLPVTRALIGAVKPQYRDAFATRG